MTHPRSDKTAIQEICMERGELTAYKDADRGKWFFKCPKCKAWYTGRTKEHECEVKHG